MLGSIIKDSGKFIIKLIKIKWIKKLKQIKLIKWS